jgi:anti-sigma factor RsiW
MTCQREASTLAAERYLLDEMTEQERQEFESHYFVCPECADDVRAGELLRTATMALPVEAPAIRVPAPSSPLPFPSPQPARGSTTVIPWAAAAALALVAGYQSLFVVPALRRDVAPQALDAVTLRPASRGSETVVRLRKGQTAVLLALDVNVAATSPELEYELKADDGSSRLVEHARTPAPGAPLLLLMPASRLSPGHQFEIVVRSPSQPAPPLGEYRFTVASDSAS